MSDTSVEPNYQPHVLVIDDDSRLCALLERYLSEHGYLVTKAASAEMALAYIEAFVFEAIVVDVMMPGMSGLDMTRRLRDEGRECPVLVLSAMGEPLDRVQGLESGANDYLAKPFEPKELLLRLKNLIRSTTVTSAQRSNETHIQIGDNFVDLDRSIVRRGDLEHRLTSSECHVLKVLAGRAGSVVNRDVLARSCPDVSNARTVDVMMARLRRKLGDTTAIPRWIVTHRGQGYALHPDSED